ncbi:MAG: helix-turn-helix transcriptional regulator [Deltaproteobacteria bacterium]|nr:helix-turn-helix transcriptional regulator [Deltaproteobacteria bacterium]
MKGDMRENGVCRALLEDVKKMAREIQTVSLQVGQVNASLNSLLSRENGQRRQTEEKILLNVREIIFPCLKELKKSQLNERQAACVELTEKYLREILSPFVNCVTSKYLKLSSREIQVANMVKDGKTSKEISVIMNVSSEAVDIHRNRIRKKLGLTNRKVNLRAYLMSFLNGYT